MRQNWRFYLWKVKHRFMTEEKGEFGLSAIISIAVGLIITSFIVIPSIKVFANSVMTDMQNWWNNSISSTLFPK